MCGIFLVFSKSGSSLHEGSCKSASMELNNRGPDHFKSSFFRNKTLFISNTILSITGKLSKKKTITKSMNNNYSISFNGEVYNYSELLNNYLSINKMGKNTTDTEVLVNLHEKINYKSIPILLNGMFAYVVYDQNKDRLIIANDVQGEKNLYFYEDNNYFILASTIKAILKFTKIYHLDETTIKNYFITRHFMPIKRTCFKSINIFENGSVNKYSLRTKKMSMEIYEKPSNWISEIKYQEYSKMKESELVDFLDFELNKQIKIMIPKINFGCTISGGVDSSLQAAIISKYKDPYKNFVIDHGNKKDSIMHHISKFNTYFKKNISKIKVNEKKYIKLAKQCYEIISSPMHTHDLPGRLEISKYFRKHECKVFFSADGCDELLGGQQIYEKIYKKNYDLEINQSPYSTIINKLTNNDSLEDYKIFLDNKWKNTFKKYAFIESKKDRNIQSSLFLDYFIQSVSVGNRVNDLISCNNSVEPRNAFISKNILKIIINLPLKYKINFQEKNKNFKQKYILKKIFCKYFDESLLFPKQGFSGFPGSLIKDKNFPLTENVISSKLSKFYNNKKYYDFSNLKRDYDWKFTNTENFLKIFFKN